MTQDHTVVYAPSEEAGHYGDVVAAETRCVDLDDDVVRTGFRGFDVAHLELRRRSRLLDEERLQSAIPRAGWGRCSAVTLIVSASERSLSTVSGLSSANGVDASSR